MRSACVVSTRFTHNNFSGIGLGRLRTRRPPWLRPCPLSQFRTQKILIGSCWDGADPTKLVRNPSTERYLTTTTDQKTSVVLVAWVNVFSMIVPQLRTENQTEYVKDVVRMIKQDKILVLFRKDKIGFVRSEQWWRRASLKAKASQTTRAVTNLKLFFTTTQRQFRFFIGKTTHDTSWQFLIKRCAIFTSIQLIQTRNCPEVCAKL